MRYASTTSNPSPGLKLRSTATGRPSMAARCQWRDRSSGAGPLAPKWVQRRSPVIRRDGTPGERSVTSTGVADAGHRLVEHPLQDERCERRGRGDDRVSEFARHGVARAVAACLRHRHSAAGQHHTTRAQRPVLRGDRNPPTAGAMGSHAGDAAAGRPPWRPRRAAHPAPLLRGSNRGTACHAALRAA